MTSTRSGSGLQDLLTVEDFRRVAALALPKAAYDYFRSGADEERTLRANTRAFRDLAIWPRVLVDVAQRDLGATVLGTAVSSPIAVAPTAYHKLACPEGERATARAAAEVNALFVVSSLATTTLEEIAAAATGPKWFQLYVHKDRGFTAELVRRAEASGYAAIALTADTPLLGRRLADLRNRFMLPPPLTMANLPPPGETFGAGHRDPASALAAYVASRHDPSLSWDDLAWLRGLTRLPIAVKGILRQDDARQAVALGADAIWVSNHGGRQLDGAPATIEALPGVVAAVEGRCPVLFDGGIRWGTDAFKAIALGAALVFVGRPILWGLAAGGEAGARHVLSLLREELSRAMALAGCRTLAEIRPDFVSRRSAGSQSG